MEKVMILSSKFLDLNRYTNMRLIKIQIKSRVIDKSMAARCATFKKTIYMLCTDACF